MLFLSTLHLNVNQAINSLKVLKEKDFPYRLLKIVVGTIQIK